MNAQSVRVSIANWVLLLAGLVNIVVGTLQATAGNVALAGTCLTAGLVLLLAGTIERFESLKGLGLEAKTVKLESKLQQADEIVQKLREVTETVCPVLVSMNARAGRWDSAPSPQEAYDFARKVERVLVAAGSTKEAIRAALMPWAQTLALDLSTFLIQDIILKVKTTRGDPGAASLVEAMAKGAEDRAHWPLERFPEWLTSLGKADLGLNEADAAALREAVSKWVPELEWLRDHLDLRNQEAWFRQASPNRRTQSEITDY